MSAITVDGFDHYGNVANMLGDIGWTTLGHCLLTSTQVRTGAFSLQMFDDSLLVFNSGTLDPHVILGFAFYPTFLGAGSQEIATFYSSGGTSTRFHTTVRVNAGGFLEIGRWIDDVTFAVVFTSAFPVLFTGTYQYFEVDFNLSLLGTGFCDVYREGVLVGSYAGATANSDRAFDCSVISHLVSGNTGKFMDDYYFINASDGVSPDTPLGSIKCRTVFPTADTAQADWALNGAGTGFGCINSVPQDIATKFLSSAAAADQSLFDVGDLPSTVSAIAAVCLFSFQEKSDAGVCTTKTQCKSGATTDDGNTNAVSTGPGYFRDIFRHDPNTGADWTRAGFNAAQFGIERVS